MIKKIVSIALLLLSQTLVFGQVRVTFKTGDVSAFKTNRTSIFLAGDFNNWDPSDARWQMQPGNTAGQYQLAVSMATGKYSFKVTKGSWEAVECGAGGADVNNRDISIVHDTTIIVNIAGWKDDYPATPKKHTASANVHIISEKFDMPQLGRQRRIWVYLPADYATSHKKYPVIYMHDGQNLFDELTSGYGEWGVDELLDKMPVKDQCIIVGIDHGGDYRITEYDPYDSKYGKGRGNDYVDFLAKTLKPYIDKNYRTQKDAGHTTVAGSSMGGLISAYAIFKYPDVFGNAGVFSPSFWIAPDIFNYAQQSKLSNSNHLYFVCGDSEGDGMVADMQKMATLLQAKGISNNNSPTTIIKGAKHNEKQWNGDFPAFYSWLISKY
jgi:predicted alpha/beta superfamily hydrolase